MWSGPLDFWLVDQISSAVYIWPNRHGSNEPSHSVIRGNTPATKLGKALSFIEELGCKVIWNYVCLLTGISTHMGGIDNSPKNVS